MAQRSLKDSTLTIKDGGANSVSVNIGEGNVTWDESRTIEYTLSKGNLDYASGGRAREGDDAPITVSFDAIFEYYVSAGSEPVTPVEALKKIGAASGWATSDTDDVCAPYAVDIEVAYNPDCTTGITNPIETITFPKFRWESISFDVSAGTIAFSGTCQVTAPTVVRSS